LTSLSQVHMKEFESRRIGNRCFYANARKKRNVYAFNVNVHKSLSRMHVNATVCPEHDLHHSLRRWVMKERSSDCSQWSLQRRDSSRLPLFASAEPRMRTCAHIHACMSYTYDPTKWVISLLLLLHLVSPIVIIEWNWFTRGAPTIYFDFVFIGDIQCASTIDSYASCTCGGL